MIGAALGALIRSDSLTHPLRKIWRRVRTTRMGELYEYLGKFFWHWWPIVAGGSLVGITEYAENYWEWGKSQLSKIPEKRRRNFKLAAIVLCVFYAGFQAWKDEHAIVENLTHEVKEKHERDKIRNGLRKWYEQATGLYEDGIRLSKSGDQAAAKIYSDRVDKWSTDVEKWLKDNMGQQAVDRMLELSSTPLIFHTTIKDVGDTMTVLGIQKKALADMIESNAWDK